MEEGATHRHLAPLCPPPLPSSQLLCIVPYNYTLYISQLRQVARGHAGVEHRVVQFAHSVRLLTATHAVPVAEQK